MNNAGLADSARSLKKSSQDVSQLTEKLNAVTLERNAAVEKLNGIQQLMAGYDFLSVCCKHTARHSRLQRSEGASIGVMY